MKEHGKMDDIDWDFMPKKYELPDIQSGAQVQQESPYQKPVDVVPEIVKTRFIEVSTWLIQNKKPEELTPAEASTIRRGSMYLALRTPKTPVIQTPTAKLDIRKFTTVTPTVPQNSSEPALTR